MSSERKLLLVGPGGAGLTGTIGRLNRRCQKAEAALADAGKVIESLQKTGWAGGHLGRALLAWQIAQEREQTLEQLKSLLEALESNDTESAKEWLRAAIRLLQK